MDSPSKQLFRVQAFLKAEENFLQWHFGEECGSCTKWMCRDCPREYPDGAVKRIRIVGYDEPICDQYELSEYDTVQLNKCKSNIAMLSSQMIALKLMI